MEVILWVLAIAVAWGVWKRIKAACIHRYIRNNPITLQGLETVISEFVHQTKMALYSFNAIEHGVIVPEEQGKVALYCMEAASEAVSVLNIPKFMIKPSMLAALEKLGFSEGEALGAMAAVQKTIRDPLTGEAMELGGKQAFREWYPVWTKDASKGLDVAAECVATIMRDKPRAA
ncbi:MAG: hypothetical protein K8R48_01320 [Alphaproteobacteria bacterium]|nr:hypothetical protein [Alphaproteobacteria bacterium]